MPIKTRTEILLEQWLINKEYKFEYEPFNKDQKNPDYLVYTDNGNILIEVKEIDISPILKFKIDCATKIEAKITSDQCYKKVRKEIFNATKQIKPHLSKAKFKVIIFGLKHAYDQIHITDFLYALVGDPILVVDKLNKKSKFFYQRNGAIRKNSPFTKLPTVCHGYISAFGIIQDSRMLNNEGKCAGFVSDRLSSDLKSKRLLGKSRCFVENELEKKWVEMYGATKCNHVILELVNYKSGSNPLTGKLNSLCKYRV